MESALSVLRGLMLTARPPSNQLGYVMTLCYIRDVVRSVDVSVKNCLLGSCEVDGDERGSMPLAC